MTALFTSLTDEELRQLVRLLAQHATPASLERNVAEVEAIGAELWHRSRQADRR